MYIAQSAGAVEYTDCISADEYPKYDTKQSDVEVPVLLELWVIGNATSLPSLPGPLWPGVVAPDRVLSMGQIELSCGFEFTVFVFKLRIYAKLNCSK